MIADAVAAGLDGSTEDPSTTGEELVELHLSEVAKTYHHTQAVDGVSLTIGPGVLGLLGPNGAGKSSLMRILATITRPSSGAVTFDGTDIVARPRPLRQVLGYLPQDFGTHPHLGAREFLRYLAAAKGLTGRSAGDRVDELLELVNLADAAKRPLGTFSTGMRQRVGIAQALLNDPRLLIVDEPTVGLDPEERMRVRNLLGELARDRIVILSTHIVSDIEAIAGDIAILSRGNLRWRGTPEGLLGTARGSVWELTTSPHELPALQERGILTRAVRTPQGVRVRLVAPVAPAAHAAPVEPDLEDAYLHAVHSPSVQGAMQ